MIARPSGPSEPLAVTRSNAPYECPHFTTVPLAESFVARVEGLDLSKPLDAEVFGHLNRAFLRHKVLSFPDQDLTMDAQAAFAAQFGTLQVHVLNQYHHEGRPDVLTISNLDAEGRPKGAHPDPGACIWHSDGSWQVEPVLATCLLALTIPPDGGDTLFADLMAAFRALPEPTKARYRDLSAIHDLNRSRQRTGALDQMTEDQKAKAPPVRHPLVRRHPETGEEGLYLGEHAWRIEGLPEDDGVALVEDINAHITAAPFRHAYRWHRGDFVLWDNRAVLHKATPFDTARHARVLRRATTLGAVAPGPMAQGAT